MTPLVKNTLVGLWTSMVIFYGVSKLIYGIDNPLEIYENLFGYSYRRKIKNDLLHLKLNSNETSGLRFLSSEVNSSPNRKENLIGRIKDHTVKIARSCRESVHYISQRFGTGWFLDYEIPKEPNGYPLKWFLATNSHVINEHTFKSNPYNQVLPVKLNEIERVKCFYDGITLYKWEPESWDDKMFRDLSLDPQDPDNWSHPEIKKIFKNHRGDFPHSKDLGLMEYFWKRSVDIPLMEIWIRDPKLFYAPYDFMFNIGNHHFKDFAVLEINFPNEKTARRMTEKIYNSPERINFLGEITSDKSEFFSAGYPGNSYNHYKIFGNYSRAQDSASNLVNCSNILKLKSEDPSWSGIKYSRVGCYYYLQNNNLGEGSSGSMVLDIEGNLLGLHTLGDEDNTIGFAEPIRKKKDCLFLSFLCTNDLEYDLIRGGHPNQRTSYKQQVTNYGLKTYLSSQSGW